MTGSRIFIDTAPYIYQLEGAPDDGLTKRMHAFFKREYNAGASFITSTITFEEYLVHPYKEKDDECISRFRKFIKDTLTKVFQIDEGIASRAAKIRAEYMTFKAMDSLQLAAAYESGCDVFLTNDKKLKQFTDLDVVLVEELEGGTQL